MPGEICEQPIKEVSIYSIIMIIGNMILKCVMDNIINNAKYGYSISIYIFQEEL